MLLFLSGFFSMAESSLFSLGRHQRDKLLKEGKRGAKRIESLLREPFKLIITILFADEVCNVAYCSVVALMVRRAFVSPSDELLTLLSVLIAAPTLLLFGEIGPKTLGLKFPRFLSQIVSYPVGFFHFILAPIRFVVMLISIGIIRLFGVRFDQDVAHEFSPQEVEALVGLGGEQGVITEKEVALASRLFKLDDFEAYMIMTPGVECFFLSSSNTIRQAREEVQKRGFSRIPVYAESKDNIVGVVFAKDLLTSELDEQEAIEKILRPPYFIPRTKGAFELLKEFRQQRDHMALVVDEFGRVDGIVTMDDVLEELFGEFEDERRTEEPDFIREGNSFYVLGSMKVDEFNDFLLFNILRFGGLKTLGSSIEGSIIPQGASGDTIAGFVFNLFGSFPKVGEEVQFGSLLFTIKKVSGKRITQLKVERKDPEVADVA